MKPRSKVLVSIIVFTLLVSVGIVGPAPVILAQDDDLRAAVNTRAALGLPADPAYVAALRGAPDDVGTARWNIPLTRAEADEVQARFAFAAATRQAVLPFAESLPTFAGAYFDHQARGELVILLTAADDAILSKIRALAPAGRRTRVEIVAHTEAALRAAVPTAWEAWRAAGGPEAYAIAVDTPRNAIRIDVDAANLAAAQQYVAEVSTAIGLPVFVGVGERPTPAACTDRDHCTSPMYAGIVVRMGSTTSTSACTMGFQIKAGTDVQFVTAGHCGAVGTNFYHQGYGFVGSGLKTQYANNGRDIMTVQMPDSQGSSLLYANSVAVSAMYDPYTGEGVCASRGFSSPPWACGVVQNAYVSWTDSICNCTSFGGDSSISFIPGDSGSPIVDASNQYIAIGVANLTNGEFARVEDALTAWGYQLR